MSILDQIVADRIRDVITAQQLHPLSELQKRINSADKVRDFGAALRCRGVRIIGEIKRASPSVGVINPGLVVPDTACAYERGGAAALSVLTEARYFQGSYNDLQEACAAVALPVLRKDFVIDPYQVYETRAWGADALLLIVRILDDIQLHDLYSLSQELGLGILTEVFDEHDTERALLLGADLIGINNRDLTTFASDLNRTVRIRKLIGTDALCVALSGIKTKEDLQRLYAEGINAFLIGERLSGDSDPELLLQEWCSSLRNDNENQP